MAQNPGFPQCLQSVNIPLLPFLLYVVTRLSLLFSLFIDLMCVHIIVRVCTCMCGSQRLASDILLITIFGDKVSLNSELPSLSRLNWSVKPGDPPSLLLQSWGCRNVLLCPASYMCTWDLKSDRVACVSRLIHWDIFSTINWNIFLRRNVPSWRGSCTKERQIHAWLFIMIPFQNNEFVPPSTGSVRTLVWSVTGTIWIEACTMHFSEREVGGACCSNGKWTHVTWELPTDC